jgi:vancomycin permeability regulator SanA
VIRRRRSRSGGRPAGRRRLLRWSVAFAALLLALFLVLQTTVHWSARHRVVEAAEIRSRPVALVFGASVYGKTLSATLERRVDTAVALHRAGRVSRILVSGDNSSTHYNESDAMRRYVISRGVPEADVVSDFAGFSTYETLYRAREIFGVTRPVLVTQGYHLPRAIYIARRLGMDPVGVAAPGPDGVVASGLARARETLASVKAFLQVEITRPEPTYLGPVEADLEAPRPTPLASEPEPAAAAVPNEAGRQAPEPSGGRALPADSRTSGGGGMPARPD